MTGSSSNPTRHTSQSSSGTSSQPFTSTSPISVESLLTNHSQASNPTHAALEQAVQERNSLSSQNSQLWKLIDKQRKAYNTLLKDTERIRSERDAYKAKLESFGIGGSDHSKKREKDKDRERNLRAAVSNPSLAPLSLKDSQAESAASSLPYNQPDDQPRVPEGSARPTKSRSRSDDTAPPKSPSHVPSSRSQDILSDRQWTSPVSVQVVTGPKRADSLPHDPTSSPKSESPSKRFPPQTDTSNSNGTYIPTYSPAPSQTVPPLHVTRKANNPFTTENATAPATDRPPQSPSVPVISLNEPQPSSSHSHSMSQPILATVPSPTGSHQSSLSLPQNDPPVPNGKGHPPPLSPRSRISIPFEAKQYMASLEMPNPKLELETKSHLTNQQPEPPSDPRRLEPHTSPTNTATQDAISTPSSAPETVLTGTNTPSDFLDFEAEEDGLEDEDAAPIIDRSAEKGKARMDDFPLPPSYADPQAHAQAHAMALAQAPAHAQAQAKVQWGAVRPDHLKVPPGLYDSAPSPTSTAESPLGSNKSAAFRELPLLDHDLPTTHIQVAQTTIRPNDRGKEVLSFVVGVDPGNGKAGWKIEKLYSDVLGLDQRIRASVGKGVMKKIGSLPESKLWRDHAPAKADLRKAALENYLQSLINLPIKNKDEIIAFFTSDIVRYTQKPVTRAGYREGYLTKRGKNFGGWKSRYFVLQGPVLEYYESRGGAHLGSIQITGAQIGRQQRGSDRADGEKEYRHAFLVIESKKSPNGPHRHVLCAENDEERDAWVEELVRYIMGTYDEGADKSLGPSPIVTDSQDRPRNSTSSMDTPTPAAGRKLTRAQQEEPSRRDINIGAAVPISQLQQGPNNAKLFNTPNLADLKDGSPVRDSPVDMAKKVFQSTQGTLDPALPSSLPTSSPLDGNHGELAEIASPRSNSELGHYADMQAPGRSHHLSPDGHLQRKPFQTERVPTPDPTAPPNGKVKISAPMSGAPIPPGTKFKETQAEAAPGNSERHNKVISRFWNFGRPDKPQVSAVVHTPRAVFGVTLEEAIDVAEIERLPAVVYRCIMYLEEKKADQEEGIYRLSGSNAVIKSLRDRFNTEGDVDLLASDEYWDLHAVAGLLKSFFRELPATILTRELHLRFVAVVDFVDQAERINELSLLVKALPPSNHILLKALTEHLIHVVQNSSVNRMTMRNVGIVFSPTLGIPAGVFSLMLGEFDKVFGIEDGQDEVGEQPQSLPEQTPRPSDYYAPSGNAYPKGLTGVIAADDAPSDSEDSFIMEESGGETTENETGIVESSSSTSPVQHERQGTMTADSLSEAPRVTRASKLAANRGLNVSTSDHGTARPGRMQGLPMSPRPPQSPMGSGQTMDSISSQLPSQRD